MRHILSDAEDGIDRAGCRPGERPEALLAGG